MIASCNPQGPQLWQVGEGLSELLAETNDPNTTSGLLILPAVVVAGG